MSLFSAIGLGGASSAPTFNASIAGPDSTLRGNLNRSTNALFDLANTNVTGISATGQAQQDYAKGLFAQQRDQLGNDMMANQATAMANMSRYGSDAGSAERLAGNMAKNNLLAQQRLGAQQASSLADIASQDMANQDMRKYTALMALPQITQSQYGQQFNMDTAIADARNKESAINMANRQAAEESQADTLGTIGGIAGGIFGGPLGGIAGSVGGKLLSKLF